MTKLLLIDGSSLLHRAFFALPLMSNANGVFTNAVHGFMMMFNHMVAEQAPDYLAVCFDKSRHSFRTDIYADYKGTREETPQELRGQFELIKQVLDCSGVAWLEMDNYEADDLLGSLARQGSEQGWQVNIFTGDRDLLQLIDDHTTVYITRKGAKETEFYDQAAVREKYGVTPPRLADIKGLMGDSSDNIPGVAGIGEKTAVKLLSQYGDLETLYAHGDELKGKLAEKVVQGRDKAFFSRRLATICRDVPLELAEGWQSLAYDPAHDKARLAELYVSLGLRQLLSGLVQGGKSAKKPGAAQLSSPTGQTSLFDPAAFEDKPWPQPGEETASQPASASAAASPQPEPALADQADQPAFGSQAAIVSEDCILLLQEGQLIVLPPGGGPALRDPAACRDLLEDPGVAKISIEAKEAIKYLDGQGLKLAGLKDDAAIAAYLLDPSAGDYSLDKLLLENGLPLDNPAAWLPALCQKLRVELERRDMLRLYTDMELPLINVLAQMELAGIRVDAGRLNEMSAELSQAEAEYQLRVFEQAGRRFNLNSPKQLGVVLFEEMGVPPLKKTKSGYSTDAEVLETLALTQPICRDILDFRFVAKLRSTYTEGLAKLVGEDGKIHTCFKQTVTATGRLSSVEPNLQNIPIRQEAGRRIRRVFAPEPGDWLLAADYSQIELRVLAHISGDAKLRQAYLDGEDIHARTASEVMGVPIDQVTPAQRRAAKAVNFGIVYGISDYGLSRDLGVSRKQAQEYIELYFSRYPQVAAYQRQTILAARDKGYVETLFGRRRYLPDLANRNFNLRSFAERVAMNAPIQGSAADIIKLAMIEIDRELRSRGLRSRMLLQVHDELIFNVPPEELEIMKELVRARMEHSVELSVPLTVEVKQGRDWYDMEEA